MQCAIVSHILSISPTNTFLSGWKKQLKQLVDHWAGEVGHLKINNNLLGGIAVLKQNEISSPLPEIMLTFRHQIYLLERYKRIEADNHSPPRVASPANSCTIIKYNLLLYVIFE